MGMLSQIAADKYPRTAFSSFTPEPGFTLGNAIAMAWMSQLAYEATDAHNPNGIVAAIGQKFGLLQASAFAQTFSSKLPLMSVRGVIAVGPTAIVVAFAGTEPLTPGDYITDFEAKMNPDDVHHGFEAAVDAAWAPDIKPALEAAAGKALFLTGHSMGGTLAFIAAARAASKQINVTAVYTIGAARPGGAKFADAYPLGDKTFRLVYGNDMVSALPPMFPLGYRHVGRMLFCPRGSRFAEVALSPAGEDNRRFDKALLAPLGDWFEDLTRHYPLRSRVIELLFRTLPPGIADHVPDSYLKALGQAE